MTASTASPSHRSSSAPCPRPATRILVPGAGRGDEAEGRPVRGRRVQLRRRGHLDRVGALLGGRVGRRRAVDADRHPLDALPDEGHRDVHGRAAGVGDGVRRLEAHHAARPLGEREREARALHAEPGGPREERSLDHRRRRHRGAGGAGRRRREEEGGEGEHGEQGAEHERGSRAGTAVERAAGRAAYRAGPRCPRRGRRARRAPHPPVRGYSRRRVRAATKVRTASNPACSSSSACRSARARARMVRSSIRPGKSTTRSRPRLLGNFCAASRGKASRTPRNASASSKSAKRSAAGSSSSRGARAAARSRALAMAIWASKRSRSV